MTIRHLTAAALLLVMLMGAGCTTAPITGRKQFNIYSEQQETQMGLSSFTQMKGEVPINTDPKVNEMVQRVGKRIAAAASPDLPNAQWEFVVFESPEANAFCLPGGKVGIYTGILPITKNEAGLATVMGHEVAHAASRHGGERMSQATAMGLGQSAVALATRNQSTEEQVLWNTAFATGASLGLALPYSRLQESEADYQGLIYMARAGYEPEEAVAFWERFSEYNKRNGGDNTVWFLSTHPLNETRIKQIKEHLPEARREFKPQ